MFYENKAGQAGVVLLLLAVLIAMGIMASNADFYTAKDNDNTENNIAVKDRLSLWYTDETMGDYYLAVCDQYYNDTGIRVIPTCVSGIDFITDIADKAEIGEGPDIYETSNSSLWEADLLTVAAELSEDTLSNTDYPGTAIRAMTCNGRLLGVPLYYETAFLVCNRTYLKNYAKDQIESEAGENLAQAAEDGEQPGEHTATDEEIEERVKEYIPSSFEDLKEFADSFDAPEGVKAVLGWDTNDVFFDYFILGVSIDIAGENGDDETALEIVNSDSIDSMKAFQELTAFFSIDDEETVTYASIRDSFCKGEFVFAIVSPDVLRCLDDAMAAGNFDYEYQVCGIPNIRENIAPASLSMTQCLCINPYSEDVFGATNFAEYAVGNPELLYDMSGKLSPMKSGVSVHPGADKILEEYERSVSAPKILSRSDYWMRLEIAFMQVQNGANPKNAMKNLEKTLK